MIYYFDKARTWLAVIQRNTSYYQQKYHRANGTDAETSLDLIGINFCVMMFGQFPYIELRMQIESIIQPNELLNCIPLSVCLINTAYLQLAFSCSD